MILKLIVLLQWHADYTHVTHYIMLCLLNVHTLYDVDMVCPPQIQVLEAWTSVWVCWVGRAIERWWVHEGSKCGIDSYSSWWSWFWNEPAVWRVRVYSSHLSCLPTLWLPLLWLHYLVMGREVTGKEELVGTDCMGNSEFWRDLLDCSFGKCLCMLSKQVIFMSRYMRVSNSLVLRISSVGVTQVSGFAYT